jgi:hypothetical protein
MSLSLSMTLWCDVHVHTHTHTHMTVCAYLGAGHEPSACFIWNSFVHEIEFINDTRL